MSDKKNAKNTPKNAPKSAEKDSSVVDEIVDALYPRSRWSVDWSNRFNTLREAASITEAIGSPIDYFRDTTRLRREDYSGYRLYLGRRVVDSLWSVFIAEDKGKTAQGELLIGEITEVIERAALSEIAYRAYVDKRNEINGKPPTARGGAAIAQRKILAEIAEREAAKEAEKADKKKAAKNAKKAAK